MLEELSNALDNYYRSPSAKKRAPKNLILVPIGDISNNYNNTISDIYANNNNRLIPVITNKIPNFPSTPNYGVFRPPNPYSYYNINNNYDKHNMNYLYKNIPQNFQSEYLINNYNNNSGNNLNVKLRPKSANKIRKNISSNDNNNNTNINININNFSFNKILNKNNNFNNNDKNIYNKINLKNKTISSPINKIKAINKNKNKSKNKYDNKNYIQNIKNKTIEKNDNYDFDYDINKNMNEFENIVNAINYNGFQKYQDEINEKKIIIKQLQNSIALLKNKICINKSNIYDGLHKETKNKIQYENLLCVSNRYKNIGKTVENYKNEIIFLQNKIEDLNDETMQLKSLALNEQTYVDVVIEEIRKGNKAISDKKKEIENILPAVQLLKNHIVSVRQKIVKFNNIKTNYIEELNNIGNNI